MDSGMFAGQTPQEFFRLVLGTVVGQAFSAAGYTLEEKPIAWSRGLFRFYKHLDSGLNAFIDFQQLAYAQMETSRFTVRLARTDQLAPQLPSKHPQAVQKPLPVLVVTDFGVPILPSADHWWTYRDMAELGRGLGEAGSLAVGYGMPWLSGDLTPPAGDRGVSED